MPTHAPLVPPGAAYYPVQSAGDTRSYAFLLVPGFTLLAFSSAVEPLRIANQLSQKPLYRWRVLSEGGRPVASSSGITVAADEALGPLDRETDLMVCAGNIPSAAAASAVVATVQRHHRFGGTVGGICTGAFALAHAGVLEDRRFTLHWENQPGFLEDFPRLVPTSNRFESAGRTLTCGGGAASTDMMLSLIARDHGADFAAMVSDMCLRTVLAGAAPEQRSSLAALMRSRSPALIAVVKLMNEHLEDTLSLEELSDAAGCSRRHVERLFKATVGETPNGFYRGLRLDRGRNLLSTTDMTLLEVATACGFNSVSHFSKCFKARFGTVPTRFSHRSRSPSRMARA
ncbi:transcriptional regulator, AraC family with amidase-like domain [[Luteovulum] sphaeroides subsp. megalophilum]|uniref:GlxA family transcriptional regulator n=1 Tax=Cereibacter sphaeroides TaxID=1063 RepID=UPI0003269E1F|nr:GlxA family transcriptional regulator [Cereibacter sphaeroides]MWP36971.1 helix-turn-helix domain-containing protein [Cereibacter sphaeroides]SNS90679.1 transcriptional regulator, AraC family with amidase-like domain [[Luteovulum] sphaeroides subsp. megalophilum]